MASTFFSGSFSSTLTGFGFTATGRGAGLAGPPVLGYTTDGPEGLGDGLLDGFPVVVGFFPSKMVASTGFTSESSASPSIGGSLVKSEVSVSPELIGSTGASTTGKISTLVDLTKIILNYTVAFPNCLVCCENSSKTYRDIMIFVSAVTLLLSTVNFKPAKFAPYLPSLILPIFSNCALAFERVYLVTLSWSLNSILKVSVLPELSSSSYTVIVLLRSPETVGLLLDTYLTLTCLYAVACPTEVALM